jgi:hypothetical protein
VARSATNRLCAEVARCDNVASQSQDPPMCQSPRLLSWTAITALLLLAASFSDASFASDKEGTHREQAARRHCWKRIGLKADDTPTEHQAARLKPCVHKRLGYDDPYMDQF